MRASTFGRLAGGPLYPPQSRFPMRPPTVPTASQPTQHARLVTWGHFAHTLHLVAQFLTSPVPQKAVHPPPASQRLTLLLGRLAGNEYRADLSLGPAPQPRSPGRCRLGLADARRGQGGQSHPRRWHSRPPARSAGRRRGVEYALPATQPGRTGRPRPAGAVGGRPHRPAGQFS